MISKLPKWVELGAFILALVAGFVNAIGLLSFEHQSVSHLSGTVTLLGTSFLNASFRATIHLLGILLLFLFGSAIAVLLLHGSTLKLGRHYDTALCSGVSFAVSHPVTFISGLASWSIFSSAACGLQNTLAKTYSGTVIRTTHATGIFRNLGFMLGGFMSGDALDTHKAKLF